MASPLFSSSQVVSLLALTVNFHDTASTWTTTTSETSSIPAGQLNTTATCLLDQDQGQYLAGFYYWSSNRWLYALTAPQVSQCFLSDYTVDLYYRWHQAVTPSANAKVYRNTFEQPSGTTIPANSPYCWVVLTPASSGGGTVKSVDVTGPTDIINSSGGPITNSGTIVLSLKPQPANTILAGPTTSGPDAAPAFRAITGDDLPSGIVLTSPEVKGSVHIKGNNESLLSFYDPSGGDQYSRTAIIDFTTQNFNIAFCQDDYSNPLSALQIIGGAGGIGSINSQALLWTHSGEFTATGQIWSNGDVAVYSRSVQKPMDIISNLSIVQMFAGDVQGMPGIAYSDGSQAQDKRLVYTQTGGSGKFTLAGVAKDDFTDKQVVIGFTGNAVDGIASIDSKATTWNHDGDMAVTGNISTSGTFNASGVGTTGFNNVSLKSATTTNSPSIETSGGDADVGLTITTKGSGMVVVQSPIVDVTGTVAATTGLIGGTVATGKVNNVTISGAAQNNTPSIEMSGADANVGLDIKTKGTGVIAVTAPTTTFSGDVESAAHFKTTGPQNDEGTATTELGGGRLILSYNGTGATGQSGTDSALIIQNFGGGYPASIGLHGASGFWDITSSDVGSYMQFRVVNPSTNAGTPWLEGKADQTTYALTGITSDSGTGSWVHTGSFSATGTVSASGLSTNEANNVSLAGATASGTPVIETSGTDTNVGLDIKTKGTGGVVVTAPTAAFSGTVSSTEFQTSGPTTGGGTAVTSLGGGRLHVAYNHMGAVDYQTGTDSAVIIESLGGGYRASMAFKAGDLYWDVVTAGSTNAMAFRSVNPTGNTGNVWLSATATQTDRAITGITSDSGTGSWEHTGSFSATDTISASGLSTSAANNVSLAGAAASGTPTIETSGADTDIGLDIKTKGAGGVVVTAPTSTFSGTVSSTEFLTSGPTNIEGTATTSLGSGRLHVAYNHVGDSDYQSGTDSAVIIEALGGGYRPSLAFKANTLYWDITTAGPNNLMAFRSVNPTGNTGDTWLAASASQSADRGITGITSDSGTGAWVHTGTFNVANQIASSGPGSNIVVTGEGTSTPAIGFGQLAASSDNKWYSIMSDATGKLTFNMVNDGNTSATTWLGVTRNAMTVSGISSNSGSGVWSHVGNFETTAGGSISSIGAQGNASIQAVAQGGGRLQFTDATRTTDNKVAQWIWYNGALSVRFLNDAGNALKTPLAISGGETEITGITSDSGTGQWTHTGKFHATGGVSATEMHVVEGENAKQGIATLVAGTVTVDNTSVTANSRIFLTGQDDNVKGSLRVSARVSGTSFTITSNDPSDSGVVAYEIFEPAT